MQINTLPAVIKEKGPSKAKALYDPLHKWRMALWEACGREPLPIFCTRQPCPSTLLQCLCARSMLWWAHSAWKRALLASAC